MWTKIIVGVQVIILVVLTVVLVKVYGHSSKLAYVDSAKLMEKSKAMQMLQGQLKVEGEKSKSNIDTLIVQFENSMKEYERNVGKMNTREKSLAQQLLQTKQSQLVKYQQAIKQKTNQDEQAKMQEVLKGINQYISEYGKKHGYQIILATSNGNIAYADEAVDITDDIVAGINQ